MCFLTAEDMVVVDADNLQTSEQECVVWTLGAAGSTAVAAAVVAVADVAVADVTHTSADAEVEHVSGNADSWGVIRK